MNRRHFEVESEGMTFEIHHSKLLEFVNHIANQIQHLSEAVDIANICHGFQVVDSSESVSHLMEYLLGTLQMMLFTGVSFCYLVVTCFAVFRLTKPHSGYYTHHAMFYVMWSLFYIMRISVVVGSGSLITREVMFEINILVKKAKLKFYHQKDGAIYYKQLLLPHYIYLNYNSK